MPKNQIQPDRIRLRIQRDQALDLDPSDEEMFVPERHSLYYLEDSRSGLVLQHDLTLYRLPRDLLSQSSEFWHHMLTDLKSKEGESDNNPVYLSFPNAIGQCDFENLLSIMLPRFDTIIKNGREPLGLETPLDLWLPVLRLSTAWMMHSVRKHIIRLLGYHLELQAMKPIERVKLALGPGIKVADWFLTACERIVSDGTIIPPLDARLLPSQVVTTLELERMRYRMLQNNEMQILMIRVNESDRTPGGLRIADIPGALRNRLRVQLRDLLSGSLARETQFVVEPILHDIELHVVYHNTRVRAARR